MSMRHGNPRTFWPVDGSDHHDVSREAIYITPSINSFLNSEQKLMLIACKGMGKTLLLRSKKKIVEERRDGYLIIPRGQEYDEPKIPHNISQKYKNFKNTNFWSGLWKISILFSILTHQSSYFLYIDKTDEIGNINIGYDEHSTVFDEINKLPLNRAFILELNEDIKNQNERPPSYYLSKMLIESLSSIEKTIKLQHVITAISQKYVRSGVFVFIDGFDQTLAEVFADDLEVWKNAQIGLILACHYLKTENRHIKVFASVRQEAFAGYKGQHREVLKGKSVLLDYSETDLKEMFTKNIRQYSDCETIEEFVGLKVIHNSKFNIDEDPFKYIYRHSSRTPRSLMLIGQSISTLDADNCIKPAVLLEEFKSIVNEVSLCNIKQDYLEGQKQIFLKYLHDDRSISCLFKKICSNVMNQRSLKAINREFAKYKNIDENNSHPFCELFNIGLLGTHRPDHTNTQSIQYFKKPNDFDWEEYELIRPEKVYFLHPSFHSNLMDSNQKCRINLKTVIGDGYKWNFKSHAELFPLVFISHSSDDKTIIEALLPSFDHELSLLCSYNIWYDKQSIGLGHNIHPEVEKGVKDSDIVIVFISKNSLNSGWVDREWRGKHTEEIETGKISVVGVLIDDTPFNDVPDFLKAKKILKLPDCASPEFNDNIKDLASGIWHLLEEANLI